MVFLSLGLSQQGLSSGDRSSGLAVGGVAWAEDDLFLRLNFYKQKNLLISILFMMKVRSPPCSGSCCRSEARFAERQIGVTFSLPGQGRLHFWTKGELEIGRNWLLNKKIEVSELS